MHYDVAIIGAGPAGSAASMKLSENGINHCFIDSSSFPRDKICGDALSGKVVNYLKKELPSLLNQLSIEDGFLPSHGIKFISTQNKTLHLPFKKEIDTANPPGYVASRLDFDHRIFSKAQEKEYCTYINDQVKTIQLNEDKYVIKTKQDKNLSANYIIGSDGAQSIVKRQLFQGKSYSSNASLGIRQYWEGVDADFETGFIELHYFDSLLPGYFWIFPMSDNRCNVGLGLLAKDAKKYKINIKKLFERIINDEDRIKHRFRKGYALEEVKTWGLPLYNKKTKLVNNKAYLSGDAASLIDPFTGEGISNALWSGKWAAEEITDLLQNKKPIISYQQKVYKKLGAELKTSLAMQKLSRKKYLLNFVIRKAEKNKQLKSILMNMFSEVDLRKELKNPLFYLKLLFR